MKSGDDDNAEDDQNDLDMIEQEMALEMEIDNDAENEADANEAFADIINEEYRNEIQQGRN